MFSIFHSLYFVDEPRIRIETPKQKDFIKTITMFRNVEVQSKGKEEEGIFLKFAKMYLFK